MEDVNQFIPNSLDNIANLLKERRGNIKDLIFDIRNLIDIHTRSLNESYLPKSIIESRFTPAEEAFERGFRSCGAIANMGAKILRQLGYKVKLIHGESKESVDHAWISIYDNENDSWKEFDMTLEDLDIPTTHIKKGEVDSWEEIRDQIEEDYKTMIERRKNKGLA